MQEVLKILNRAISIGRFPIVSDRDTILNLVVEARDALIRGMREERAACAYLRTFEGYWGSKASEEDAVHSVLTEIYGWPAGWEGIRLMRGHGQIPALVTECYEDHQGEGEEAKEIVAWLLPRLDEILRVPTAAEKAEQIRLGLVAPTAFDDNEPFIEANTAVEERDPSTADFHGYMT